MWESVGNGLSAWVALESPCAHQCAWGSPGIARPAPDLQQTRKQYSGFQETSKSDFVYGFGA